MATQTTNQSAQFYPIRLINNVDTTFTFVDNKVVIDPNILQINGNLHESLCLNLLDILLGFVIQGYDIVFDHSNQEHKSCINYFLNTAIPYMENLFVEIKNKKMVNDPIYRQITTDEKYVMFVYRTRTFINNTNQKLIETVQEYPTESVGPTQPHFKKFKF